MKVIIDRFEEDFAIVELENKEFIHMPKKLVPSGAQEGDMLEIRIDYKETKDRKKKIDSLMEDLWE